MSELNVYFWGLICHVSSDQQPNDAEVAALVRAPCHSPKIIFGPDSSQCYVLQEGADIQFDHGTESANIDRPSFNAYVPSLRQILGGELRLLPQAALKFHYPRADRGNPELSVFATYDDRADHTSKSSHQKRRRNQPVARLIRLRVELKRDEVVVRFKSGDQNVAQIVDTTHDSCILVANVEPPYAALAERDLEAATQQLVALRAKERSEEKGMDAALEAIQSAGRNLNRFVEFTCPPDVNHFEYYSLLLAGADVATADPFGPPGVGQVFSGNDCGWVMTYVDAQPVHVRAATRPECGNTVYP